MSWLMPNKELPYNQSKEYLDKQQKIDYLLVLAKLLEPGMSTTKDNLETANLQIRGLLEKLK